MKTLELKPIEELVKFDVNKKEHVKSKINIETNAKTLFHRILQITRVLQMNLAFWIKSKIVLSWSLRKKKEYIFCNDYFVWGKLF